LRAAILNSKDLSVIKLLFTITSLSSLLSSAFVLIAMQAKLEYEFDDETASMLSKS